MNIPQRFKSSIENDQKLNGIVNYTLSEYNYIFIENILCFFKEYTDHGIKHIESVLNSTVKIIPEETFKNILDSDSQSTSVYILAVILHDLGMHIRAEGFYELISGSNDDIRIKDIDSKTWKELWNDYLDEARRFGDEEKKNIIGNINWNFKIPEIENKDKLTGEDKKLVGEFIRRNHPRIAHEIAIKGFPTKKNEYIPFAPEMDIELRNICGLIARSHGVNIRTLFPYLEKHFNDTWSKPYNIEIVYLMVLLRIADYFQIESSRTPKVTVKLKTFNSPISLLEHKIHLGVKYSQPYAKDPETLIFQCNPEDSVVFIKLQDLLDDIQKELDKSWAILGEIYGKESKDKQPNLSYRRIKSNIDDISEFSKKAPYIPEKIIFNVSNELPKLLIGPLYGNDPSYGIRELIQNAVDSCRERELLEKEALENSNYIGKVKIEITSDFNNYYLEIEDNGLGMNSTVIKKYFLEVGSSYRKSSEYKKIFTTIEGESKILRSGKFGIGVLASFLIGDHLQIKTRDLESDLGLSFSTDLSVDQIEIRKNEVMEVGTIIKIRIKNSSVSKLKNSKLPFNKWYVQNNPKLEIIDTTNTFNLSRVLIKSPDFNSELDSNWRKLKTKDYDKIIWTYDDKYWNLENSIFISNGIIIPNLLCFKFKTKELKELKMPYISVFDSNGNLPVNLNRNNLDQGIIPFEENLKMEIYKDILSKLLTDKFEFTNNLNEVKNQTFNHPAIKSITVLFSKDGFILKDNFFTDKNKVKTLFQFYTNSNFISLYHFDFKNSFIEIIDENIDFNLKDFQEKTNLKNYSTGAKMYLTTSMYLKLFDIRFDRYPMIVKKNHRESRDEVKKYSVINYKFYWEYFSMDDISKNLENCNCIIETHLKAIDIKIDLDSSSFFYELLEKYMNDHKVIPYDLEERKEMFKLAFKELDYYIKKYTS